MRSFLSTSKLKLGSSTVAGIVPESTAALLQAMNACGPSSLSILGPPCAQLLRAKNSMSRDWLSCLYGSLLYRFEKVNGKISANSLIAAQTVFCQVLD
ncbi:hypothetical protein V2G26_016543 [Clonostachys chloroleuca]